jgi:hypothetical protein
MRRGVPLVVALLASVGAPGMAGANNAVKLKVAFQPDRPGVRTTIQLALRISGPRGAPPSPVTGLDLRMPAHMGIATTTLGQASCEQADLIEGGLNGCSANARIGFGTALAVVPFGPERVPEQVSINALMGPPSGEQLGLLFYVEGLAPVYAQLVFPGVVIADTSPFGERIDTLIPLVPVWPQGPNVSFETFESTIGPLHLIYHRQVNGKTISYQPHGIRVPKRCPPGGYPFAVQITFEDGTSSSADYHVPCHLR